MGLVGKARLDGHRRRTPTGGEPLPGVRKSQLSLVVNGTAPLAEAEASRPSAPRAAASRSSRSNAEAGPINAPCSLRNAWAATASSATGLAKCGRLPTPSS
jgi:hypothetical protein